MLQFVGNFEDFFESCMKWQRAQAWVSRNNPQVPLIQRSYSFYTSQVLFYWSLESCCRWTSYLVISVQIPASPPRNSASQKHKNHRIDPKIFKNSSNTPSRIVLALRDACGTRMKLLAPGPVDIMIFWEIWRVWDGALRRKTRNMEQPMAEIHRISHILLWYDRCKSPMPHRIPDSGLEACYRWTSYLVISVQNPTTPPPNSASKKHKNHRIVPKSSKTPQQHPVG